MSERPGRSSGVIGPAGQPLTVENLPPRNTVRWVIRRKAEVVAAVRNGLIGLDEACERYRLSVEEFLNWERLVSAHGLRGLRTTRTQAYRQSERDDNPAQRLSRDGISRGIADSGANREVTNPGAVPDEDYAEVDPDHLRLGLKRALKKNGNGVSKGGSSASAADPYSASFRTRNAL